MTESATGNSAPWDRAAFHLFTQPDAKNNDHTEAALAESREMVQEWLRREKA